MTRPTSSSIETPRHDAIEAGIFMNTATTIVRCSRCGTKNRIPIPRLHDRPICGKCKTPLSAQPSYDSPVDVTDKTFRDEVLSFSGSVLMDCWAPWCGPCRMVAPVLNQLAAEYAGRIKIAKLNVDENPMTASQYAIQSIPTMLLFKNGQQVHKLVGALPKEEIERHLISVL
jgi:thioredoxin 2